MEAKRWNDSKRWSWTCTLATWLQNPCFSPLHCLTPTAKFLWASPIRIHKKYFSVLHPPHLICQQICQFHLQNLSRIWPLFSTSTSATAWTNAVVSSLFLPSPPGLSSQPPDGPVTTQVSSRLFSAQTPAVAPALPGKKPKSSPWPARPYRTRILSPFWPHLLPPSPLVLCSCCTDLAIPHTHQANSHLRASVLACFSFCL